MAETVRIEIPIETIDETESGVSSAEKNLEKLNKAATRAGESTERARKKVSQFDKSAEKTQRDLAKWAKEKYEILLEAKERITPILQSLGNGLRNIAGKTWRVTMRAIDLVTSPVRGIINLLRNPVFQVGAVLGVSIGLKDTIDTYKDFEAAMSQVSAVSGATGTDLDKLTEKAKEMGASTKFTASEAAEGFNYMAMAGWKTKDMIDGIEGILSLAAASGEELGTTSDIVTDALTAFGLQAKDSSHFADVLAQASSNANTNVGMMGESFKYIAPVAGAMKYSVEDVSLALGLMANASVKSSMAGTSLKTALVNMAKPTEKMEAAMDKYGISLADKSGKAKDLKGVLDNLRGSLGALSETEQTAAAGTIFGKEAMAGMLAIINASEEDYNKLAKAINNADGASERMADTMLDNLEGSITLLNSAMDGVKISFGERLSPYVRSLADWLTEQMPAIEQGLDEMMDRVDSKVARMNERLKEISSTPAWQDAGFFGKANILWDEFIATPFSEWWNSEGKSKIADVAGEFGSVLGSGINAGILTLLGFDVSGTLDEGANIGASFAKGFADGFDFEEISSKLWDGLKNIVANAAKLLPGGESAGLSSLLSAALLAKIAGPLISAGSGGIKLGKMLLGSGGAAGGGSLVGSLLGSTGAGTGLLGFGANTAINLGAGNLAGGASLGAGALSAVGLGATAGGVAAGASLISGGLDFYKATKAQSKEESDAYTESGAWKVGGVAAGAAAGAAIGSVVPVLGTAVGALIGAGVGGIAGFVKGNKVKEEYEENLEAAQEAAEKAQKVYSATGRDIEDVRFKTQALTDAMNDSEVSAQEFSQMFQEAVVQNLGEHFGDVSLSLKEVKEAAAKIAFDNQTESINIFMEAAQKADSSLVSLQGSMRELKKANWQVSIGTQLSNEDKEQYKGAIDSFAESAKDYLKNQHYEATVALELLTGDNDSSLTDGLDSMYSKMQEKIESYQNNLDITLNASMKDGIIDIDEAAEIQRLQDKIASITSKLTEAQEEASFSSMKIKYSGASLDADSFASMQEELQNNVNSMADSYDNALQVSLTNLQLQRDEGAIDKGTYDELYQKIADGYNEQMKGLQDRVEDFQLDSIVDAYRSELENILPELEGDTIERLKAAMNTALSIEPDAAQWTSDKISTWFGLDRLDTETQTAVSELLQKTAQSIPESVANSLHENMKLFHPEYVTEALNDSSIYEQLQTSGSKYGETVTTGASNSILAGSSLLRTSAQSSVDSAFASPFNATAQINVDPNYNVNGTFKLPEISVSGTGKASNHSGGGSALPTPTKHAAGGYAANKQLSWLAEEGYGEFVIPTNPGRRGRALELYEQAGRALGVGNHANGGYVAPAGDMEFASYSNADSQSFSFSDDGQSSYSAPVTESNSNGTTTIEVNVEVNPEFTINDTEQSEDIVEVIRRHIREMADELGGEIAAQLEDVFSNMPLKEA